MATHESTIPTDPTQERFAEAVLFIDYLLSAFVDRVHLIIDRSLAKTERGSHA